MDENNKEKDESGWKAKKAAILKQVNAATTTSQEKAIISALLNKYPEIGSNEAQQRELRERLEEMLTSNKLDDGSLKYLVERLKDAYKTSEAGKMKKKDTNHSEYTEQEMEDLFSYYNEEESGTEAEEREWSHIPEVNEILVGAYALDTEYASDYATNKSRASLKKATDLKKKKGVGVKGAVAGGAVGGAAGFGAAHLATDGSRRKLKALQAKENPTEADKAEMKRLRKTISRARIAGAVGGAALGAGAGAFVERDEHKTKIKNHMEDIKGYRNPHKKGNEKYAKKIVDGVKEKAKTDRTENARKGYIDNAIKNAESGKDGNALSRLVDKAKGKYQGRKAVKKGK
jgi:hypothetical protein